MITILIIHQSAELYGSDKTLLLLLKHIDKTKFYPVVVLPNEGILKDELEKENINDPKYGWVKRHEIIAENKYNIVLHTRRIENTDFSMTRLEGVFKNISAKAM
jgi:hypothetical protein